MGMMDEVAVFNVALPVDDIKEIMDEGLEAALGIIAVDLSGKLATTWGDVKKEPLLAIRFQQSADAICGAIS